MNTTSPQNIILTGFGFMGEMHAQAYAGIPGARIAAIVDDRIDATRTKAAKLGLVGTPLFANLREALEKVPATVVDICLPTDLHTDAAVLALDAGKHVFCEKPLALSNEQTARIREALTRSPGAFFQVGQCIRFWPEYQAFEKFYREGSAGKLLSLTLQRRSARPLGSTGNWLNDPTRSLGAALDLHIHDTDYILHLLGTPPSVFSRGTKDASGWSHIFTNYLYPDLVVQAEGGWNYPGEWGFQMAFQAVFEKAAIEYDSGASPTLRLVREGGKPEPLPFVPAGGQAAVSSGNLSSLGGYINELASFISNISAGKAPTVATFAHGAESIRVALAEIASAKSSNIIKL